MQAVRAERSEARVQRLLACAREVFARRHALEDELVQCTGLSRQGIERAWNLSFEQQMSSAEHRQLLASVAPADHVMVVLSAHVFTAALRAAALGLAASDRVVLRPSRRDPVVARELAAAWNGPELECRMEWPEAWPPGSHVHGYGSDASLAEIRARLPSGVPLRSHGTGFAVAYLEHGSVDAARSLALDVSLFDQRGCLSPRVVWAPNPSEFASHLAAAMRELASEMPLGRMSAEEQEARAAFARAGLFASAFWNDEGGMVAVGRDAMLPPTGRVVQVLPLQAALPEAWTPYLTQIVCNGAPPVWRPSGARLALLGQAQRPPLDGPVDQRA